MNNKFYLVFILILAYSTSCNNPSGETQVDQLARLKTQAKEINAQIKELEMSISQNDTSGIVLTRAKLVEIDTLKRSSFDHYIELQGMVDASQNVLASPEMGGIVKAIYVNEGDLVSAGKVLAALDGATIRKGIEEIRTGLNLATTFYDKQKRLWDQNIGSESQYLQAKGQKESLEQKLATVQSQLNMTLIKSPLSGTIDEIKLKIGEAAVPGMTGIRVVNNSKLSVKAKLSDLYAGRVRKGDQVKLYFPDLDKEINSKINYTGQTVNASSRTILIEADLPKTKDKFISNQIVKLKINDRNIKNAIVISTNLIQRSIDGIDYILVADQKDGKWFAKKTVIKPGEEYNGQTVILEGMKGGELIISTGYSEIVDGQSIQF